MKTFLLIYFLGSGISILLTIFLINDISDDSEEVFEKAEELISRKFNIQDSKKLMTPNIIFISNFIWSWAFVIIFTFGFLKGFLKKTE